MAFKKQQPQAAKPAKASKQKYPSAQSEHEGQPLRLKHLVKAKNETQSNYIESLREQTLTICAGPAGSGKTYIVTLIALEKLIAGEVDKIVLTRPVVEAGEHLGFLPGTLEEKLDPYLLPLMDAIEDHVGPQMAKRLVELGKIEIAPLAFMRGRTFNNSYVILDEAQNATVEQMRMFVTRIGYGSQFAINGDVTQSDLEKPRSAGSDWENGLQWISRKLKGKDSMISYVEFQNRDVVRSEIVRRILTHIDAPECRPEGLASVPKVNGYSGKPAIESTVVVAHA